MIDMPGPDSARLVPTPAEEARFWELVEFAWSSLGVEPNALRRSLVVRDRGVGHDSTASAYSLAVEGWLERFLDALRSRCADLPRDELTSLDRVVERRLHEIDRPDIQAVTDGSDDGFLYCRGFVVAVGQAYYEAVHADPETYAILDAECESMCYLFAHLHQERFGIWPDTGSGITRESVSHPSWWA